MRARVSGATTISTTAAAIANQNAHACRRPLSRGSGDSTPCTLTRGFGLAHCAAHAEQHLVVRDALELAPAGLLVRWHARSLKGQTAPCSSGWRPRER